MKIRAVVQADHPRVDALFEQVDALHRDALPGVFRATPGPARSEAWLAERIAREDAALLVADDGGVVGLVEVREAHAPDSPLFQPRRYAVVDTLVAQPDRRGQGIGRALMDAAHAWAKSRDLDDVEVHVWEINPAARGFYEALGYTTRSRKLGRSLD